eukprot:scaffold69356_cov48-Phaeocystis_antarctica.AAC.1
MPPEVGSVGSAARAAPVTVAAAMARAAVATEGSVATAEAASMVKVRKAAREAACRPRPRAPAATAAGRHRRGQKGAISSLITPRSWHRAVARGVRGTAPPACGRRSRAVATVASAAAAGRPRAPEKGTASPRGRPPAPRSWYRAEARGAHQRGGRGTAPPPCGRPWSLPNRLQARRAARRARSSQGRRSPRSALPRPARGSTGTSPWACRVAPRARRRTVRLDQSTARRAAGGRPRAGRRRQTRPSLRDAAHPA